MLATRVNARTRQLGSITYGKVSFVPCGDKVRDRTHSPDRRTKYSERAAERREKNALGQQLTDDAAASGSDGDAQRHFFLTARGSREHETRRRWRTQSAARFRRATIMRVEHRRDLVALSARPLLDGARWMVGSSASVKSGLAP